MPYFKGKDPKKLKFFCFQHISLIKFPKSREFPKDFTVLNWTICSVGLHKLLIFDIGKELSRGDCLQRGRGEGVEQDLTWWPSPLPIQQLYCPIQVYLRTFEDAQWRKVEQTHLSEDTVRSTKYTWWLLYTTQCKVQAICLVLNGHHSYDRRKILFQMWICF